MITLRLYTGQVLTFPDGTPEDVMHRAAQEVLSGEADRKLDQHHRQPAMDLSHLREPDKIDLSRLRAGTDAQAAKPTLSDPEEWKQHALPSDQVHVDDPGTVGRSRIRRAIDASAEAGAPGFGLLSGALDVAEATPAALGLSGATAADANVGAANLPRLPLVLTERAIRRAARPYEEASGRQLLSTTEAVPDPLGPASEMTGKWRERATEELAKKTQHLPTPVAAAMFEGATMAGLAADASQYVGGRIVEPFGASKPLTELEQAAVARSGKYLPGAREPLIYRDTEDVLSAGWKGVIPDKLRDITGRPWRNYNGPLERPTSSAPRPRTMYGRDPLPVEVIASPDIVDKEGVDRIMGLWDYASTRYPKVASQVKTLHIVQGGTGFRGSYTPGVGKLQIAADGNLGELMHEITHAAQDARGQIGKDYVLDFDSFARIEAPAVRMGDVYSRIPQPLPRRSTAPDIGIGNGVEVPGPGSRYATRTPESFRERVLAYHGITDADARRAVADRIGTLERQGVTDLPSMVNPEPVPKPPPEVVSGDPWVVSEARAEQLRAAGYEKPLMVRRPEGGYRPDVLDLAGSSPNDIMEPRTYYAKGPMSDDEIMRQIEELDLQANAAAEAGDSTRQYTARITELKKQLGQPTSPASDLLSRQLRDAGWDVGPQSPVATTAEMIRDSDEAAAEAMGWKLPSGSPRATQPIDPIRTPQFQTNIAAQVGGPDAGYFGDPEVAGYVMEESDKIIEAKGPPQSFDTLGELALRDGTTKEEFLKNNPRWAVMSPVLRHRLVYVIKGNEVAISNLQAKIATGTATDLEKAELLRRIDERGALIQIGVKNDASYGRALNSLKANARAMLSDDQMVRQQLYKKYMSQIDENKALLTTLSRLNPGNQEELQSFLRSVNKPKWHEYIHEAWVSSILSGFGPHINNAIGNTLNTFMENAVARPVAATADWARVTGPGAAKDASREVFLRETPHALAGLTHGIRDGIRTGWEIVRRGYDPLTMQGKLFPMRSAFARSQNRVVREVVGPVLTMPLRLLSASDAIMKTMNWSAELYAQAAKIASKEGLIGTEFADRMALLVKNPTDEMKVAADAFALKATFNDEASAVGKAFINLRDLPNQQFTNPVFQRALEGWRLTSGFIMPFIKIADRLMVRGLEYTPLGYAGAIGSRRIGNYAEAANQFAKASIGSTALAYAASLAWEGRLTAGVPQNEAERAAFYNANKKPWSVRTDDGYWIPFNQVQPIGLPFAIAASAWEGWTKNSKAPSTDKLVNAAAKIGSYMIDQSYMGGFADFTDAIRGTEESRGQKGARLVANTLWGFAPYSGLVRSINRAIDPRLVEAETMGDRLKQNIPGASLGMRAKLTVWGEDIVPSGGRWRSVIPPSSALAVSQERQDPLDTELARIGKPLGYTGKSLADKLPHVPKSESDESDPVTTRLDHELQRLGRPLGYVDKTISGKYGSGKSRGTWKLDQEEWYLYQQTAGRATKAVLTRLFDMPMYQWWDIERQRDEVEKAIGMAREYARMWAVRYHRGSRPRTGS